MLFKSSRFLFSSVAQKTFQKFTERYAANVAEFNKKMAGASAQAESLKKSTARAYVHPYHETYKQAYPSAFEGIRVDSDLRGAEQVSPHYEHFSFARRQALLFVGGLAALRFMATTEDLWMFAQSATWAWTFYFAYSYYWIEGKKFFVFPLLYRFYRKILGNEMQNVETYWAENTEARVRNLMATAKEQIDFKAVHEEYLSVRNNCLLNVPPLPHSSSSRSRLPSGTTFTHGLRMCSRKPRPTKASTRTRS